MPERHNQQFSFVLFCNSTLPLSCMDTILQRGHRIAAIFTETNEIIARAKDEQIPCFRALDTSSRQFLLSLEVDFILSIDNSLVLDQQILQLPKIWAVNYHDSPLPKYAGLHATAWAILNDEPIHGITWHIMDAGIDTGDILLQRLIPIEQFETTLSLNTKCYEVAIKSFTNLINGLEQKTLTPQAQNLEARSFFSSKQLVLNNGIIDLSEPAHDIWRLYRALNYGPYTNELASLKMIIQGRIFLVKQLTVCRHSSSNRPHMIIDIGTNHLRVTTSTEDIQLSLTDLYGNPVNHATSIQKLRLNIGDAIKGLSHRYRDRYLNMHKTYKSNEQFWRKQLARCIKPILPTRPEPISEKLLIKQESLSHNEKIPLFFSSLVMALCKIQDHKPLTCWVSHEQIDNKIEYLCDSYMPHVPLTFFPDKYQTLAHAHKQITVDIERLISKAPFEHELFARDRQAGKALQTRDILISIQKTDHYPQTSDDYQLVVVCNTLNQTATLFVSIKTLQDQSCAHLLSHMLSYTQNIMHAIIHQPEQQLEYTSLLSPSQEQHLVTQFNQSKQKELPEQSLYDQIYNQCKQYPNKTAVIDGEMLYSYANLMQDVKHVATQLEQLNKQQSSSFIAICFKRSYAMLVNVLAVLKIGCAYVPIDAQWPKSRVVNILHHCRTVYCLSDDNLESLSNEFNKTTELRFYSRAQPDCYAHTIKRNTYEQYATKQDQLAYLIYTSGTSGKPKAVMVSHKNVLNYFYWFAESFALQSSSIVDFSFSLAFDISVACTLVPLLAGATIAICSENNKQKPLQYLNHLHNHSVTHIECTPGYLSNMLRYPNDVLKLTSLQWLLLGAEQLIKDDIVKWRQLCPHHHLVNEYGPTECTVAVTQALIDDHSINLSSNSIPIGKPGINNKAFILDRFGNICPIGVPGELYICGESVTHGYLAHAEQNKTAFDSSMLARYTTTNTRVYATGDITRWLIDGNIDYINRKDRQVKIMGYRIELDAIKNTLISYPGISQCHLLIETDGTDQKWITAYLVIDQQQGAPSRKDIEQFLKATTS